MRDDAYVKALPDNARLTLDNGQVVTGAEVKEAWAKADFVVNDTGTAYANGTTRGEANYNNGDPVVSMNIDNISTYNLSPGGVDYLPLHEVAHVTADQRSDYAALQGGEGGYTAAEAAAFEARASDIARAITEYSGGTTLADDGGRYSPGHPTFQEPEPPVPPGGEIP
ncbi:hypothetical protein SAMN05518801_12054 [Novosphingobium sp. CF614]|uniref:hypothetical protein n=1 Tax=Novosphingobium sp. CF614 TaxID=1884364 RepID=UPI0008F2B205|nr:hypothetical protein [Novosphingobium sp. CF614]SFG37570.1 hypothetical protein SAMN05518801_12054 [Novosphingobium sp. CF614]